jgi:hypothetical protein
MSGESRGRSGRISEPVGFELLRRVRRAALKRFLASLRLVRQGIRQKPCAALAGQIRKSTLYNHPCGLTPFSFGRRLTRRDDCAGYDSLLVSSHGAVLIERRIQERMIGRRPACPGSMSTITEAGRDHLADLNFAFPKERKEPIHDAAHVRNAIARFRQVQGVTDVERDAAWKRIQSAAKRWGVELSEKDWRELS